MKFIISSKKIELTEKLKKYIKERLLSCEKYIHTDLPLVARVEVEKTIDHHKKGEVFMAKVNIVLKDKLLRTEATREDIYLAVNEIRDHLKIECKKYKDIMIQKRRQTKKELLKGIK